MITQRELDELHVSAQEFVQQIREEFQKGLLGKRGANGALPKPVPPQQSQVASELQQGDNEQQPTY